MISTLITNCGNRQAHVTRPVEPFSALNESDHACLLTPRDLASRMCPANGTHSTIDLTLIHRTLLIDAMLTTGPYIGSDHLLWSDWNKTVSALLSISNDFAEQNPIIAYSSLYSSLLTASKMHFFTFSTCNKETQSPMV